MQADGDVLVLRIVEDGLRGVEGDLRMLVVAVFLIIGGAGVLIEDVVGLELVADGYAGAEMLFQQSHFVLVAEVGGSDGGANLEIVLEDLTQRSDVGLDIGSGELDDGNAVKEDIRAAALKGDSAVLGALGVGEL